MDLLELPYPDTPDSTRRLRRDMAENATTVQLKYGSSIWNAGSSSAKPSWTRFRQEKDTWANQYMATLEALTRALAFAGKLYLRQAIWAPFETDEHRYPP
jgi:hypothetical protein